MFVPAISRVPGGRGGYREAYWCRRRARLCQCMARLRARGAPASEDRTAEQVYKNIKALQGTPAGELSQSMHLMKGALGMDCLYCHIEREWEKDVK